MAVKEKIGNQTPTKSVILPYTNSIYKDAVFLYEKPGRKAQQWQKICLNICFQLMKIDCMYINNSAILYHVEMAKIKWFQLENYIH